MPRFYKKPNTTAALRPIIKKPTPIIQQWANTIKAPFTTNTIAKPIFPIAKQKIIPKSKIIIKKSKPIMERLPILNKTYTNSSTTVKPISLYRPRTQIRAPIYPMFGTTLNSASTIMAIIVGFAAFFIIKSFMLFSMAIMVHSLMTVQFLCLTYTIIKYATIDKNLSNKSSQELKNMQATSKALTNFSAIFIITSLAFSLFSANPIFIYSLVLPIFGLMTHSIANQNKITKKLEQSSIKSIDDISQNTQQSIQQANTCESNQSEQKTTLQTKITTHDTAQKELKQNTSTKTTNHTEIPCMSIQQTQSEQTQTAENKHYYI